LRLKAFAPGVIQKKFVSPRLTYHLGYCSGYSPALQSNLG